MGVFLKQLGALAVGKMAGSNNKASFVVHTLRGAYIGTGSVILVAWYSAWRNERVAPGSISFPIPGYKKLTRQYTPDRPEKELPHEKTHNVGGTGPKVNNEGQPESSPLLTGPVRGPRGLAQMIQWCSSVSGKYPYKWGGGHPSVGHPSPGIAGGSPGTAGGPPGYDCSGAVSGALWAGGLLKAALTSGSLAGFGDPGEGNWVTIYANSVHTFMKININGTWRWFGTGSNKKALRGGPAWGNNDAGDLASYSVRHPRGW